MKSATVIKILTHSRGGIATINPDDVAKLVPAATCLRHGGLVSFPTETVYGLGANALDADAVAQIYTAKKRPPNHPLIVHVATVEQARQLTSHWPEIADRLASKFWPGPLTLILPKAEHIPDIVTAGLDNVGIRIPANPVALALLKQANIPVAAPSANPYTRVSPTTAEHVYAHLKDSLDFLIDAGSTDVGIESTIISLASQTPQLLRHGMIEMDELRALVPDLELAPALRDKNYSKTTAMPSPGLSHKHYSPRANVRLFNANDWQEKDKTAPSSTHERAGFILWNTPSEAIKALASKNTIIQLPDTPAGYASGLYAALHTLDNYQCSVIYIESPPRHSQWGAIWDRLQRAATPS